MRPPVAHSQAGALLRAVLSNMADRGVKPLDFLHELKIAGARSARHHIHELSSAARFLRSLNAHYHTRRLKEELLSPLKGQHTAALSSGSQLRSDAQQISAQLRGDAGQIGAQFRKDVDRIGPQLWRDEQRIASQLQSEAARVDAAISGAAGHMAGQIRSRVGPVESEITAELIRALTKFAARLKHATVGVGNAAGVVAGGGVTVTLEFIASYMHRVPKKYWGGEISLAAGASAATDIVLEIAPHSTPPHFGGPYIAVGGAGGEIIECTVQPNWGLKQLNRESANRQSFTPAEVGSMLNRAFQGFSVGGGLEASLKIPLLGDLSLAVGDGYVQPLPLVQLWRYVS